MNQVWLRLLERDARSEYPREEIDALIASKPAALREQFLVWIEQLAKLGTRAPREAVDAAPYICLMLAAWKVPEALPHFLALGRLKESQQDRLFGDFYTESYPWLLFRCSEGGEALLIEQMKDSRARHFPIDAAAMALAARVKLGQFPKEVWRDELRSAIEIQAQAHYCTAVSDLAHLAIESDSGIELEWLRQFYLRRLFDTADCSWDDLVRVNPRDSASSSPHPSDLDRILLSDIHAHTNWWSIRQDESENHSDPFHKTAEQNLDEIARQS